MAKLKNYGFLMSSLRIRARKVQRVTRRIDHSSFKNILQLPDVATGSPSGMAETAKATTKKKDFGWGKTLLPQDACQNGADPQDKDADLPGETLHEYIYFFDDSQGFAR